MMVFHHCYRAAEKFSGYEVTFFPFTEGQIISLAKCFKICVSIFAFVSGYGLMCGYESKMRDGCGKTVSEWIGKHLVSTLAGYWFIAPIAYCVYGIISNWNFSKWGDSIFEKGFEVLVDCLGISKILGTKSLNGTWWYMGAAISFIFILPLLAAGIKKLGGILCAGIIVLLPRIFNLGFLGGQSAYSFLMIFYLGMLCSHYNLFDRLRKFGWSEKDRRNEFLRFVIVAIVCFFCMWSYSKISLKVFWEYGYAFVPFCVIFFCVEYLFKILPIKTVLQFLGKHSMNIWLVHTFVRDWMGDWVWSMNWFVFAPLIILLISIGISMLVNVLKNYSGYEKMVKIAINKIEKK